MRITFKNILTAHVLTLLCFSQSVVFARTPEKVDVVIIGAGLSGLAAAHGLKKAGIKYHILEIAPRIGGRVRTVRYERKLKDGSSTELYADSGMEEYWESNPAVEVLKELKLPIRSDVALSSIVLNKKLEILGTETSAQFQKKIFTQEELKALLAFKARHAPVVQQLRERKPVTPGLLKLKEVAFSKWVLDQHLPPKVSEWIRISLECEIGTSWERISALDGLDEFHIFLGEGEKSYRVIGGNDKFTDALASEIGRSSISLNRRVTRIVSQGKAVSISYLDTQSNESGVVQANYVINTIPLFRLFEVQFDPPLSEKKRQAITSMSWGSYFKAHLFMQPKAEHYWTGKTGSFLPILSDSDLGVIYDGNPDQPGKTRILSLLVHGDAAEKFNLMPLDFVRSEILAAFDKLWPGFSKDVLDIEFYRFHPRAIAAWPVGRSRFDELSNEIRRPENGVYMAGDFTETSHSDGAFMSAARVVREITAAAKGASK